MALYYSKDRSRAPRAGIQLPAPTAPSSARDRWRALVGQGGNVQVRRRSLAIFQPCRRLEMVMQSSSVLGCCVGWLDEVWCRGEREERTTRGCRPFNKQASLPFLPRVPLAKKLAANSHRNETNSKLILCNSFLYSTIQRANDDDDVEVDEDDDELARASSYSAYIHPPAPERPDREPDTMRLALGRCETAKSRSSGSLRITSLISSSASSVNRSISICSRRV